MFNRRCAESSKDRLNPSDFWPSERLILFTSHFSLHPSAPQRQALIQFTQLIQQPKPAALTSGQLNTLPLESCVLFFGIFFVRWTFHFGSYHGWQLEHGEAREALLYSTQACSHHLHNSGVVLFGSGPRGGSLSIKQHHSCCHHHTSPHSGAYPAPFTWQRALPAFHWLQWGLEEFPLTWLCESRPLQSAPGTELRGWHLHRHCWYPAWSNQAHPSSLAPHQGDICQYLAKVEGAE